MTRKGLLVLVLAVFAAGGAFAQISFGVGGFFGNDFGVGFEMSYSIYGTQVSGKYEYPYNGGGAYVFFDAAYVEASFGFFSGSGSRKQTATSGGNSQTDSVDRTLTSLNIGLLGKYPIAINDSLLLFPLLGINYQIVLSTQIDGKDYEKRASGEDAGPGDFSALWFQLGAGVDY